MNRKRKDEYIWVSKKFKNKEEDMVYFGRDVLYSSNRYFNINSKNGLPQFKAFN